MKKNAFEGFRVHLRNIALRRSNPKNKWIISSNTDMVFVPRHKKQSLTDVVKTLPDGYYAVPRFEMPETLWGKYG